MPQSTFTVIKEKQAERCDICHQSDMLDLETGQCRRCKDLPLQELAEDRGTMQVIPASLSASIVVLVLSSISFFMSIFTLDISLTQSSSLILTSGEWQILPVLAILNFLISIGVHLWCSESYNETISYPAIVFGKFSSILGILTCAIGMFYTLRAILS